MAGYSGTPLAKKLGIKAGHRVALVNAPRDFESQLDGMPADVVLRRGIPSGSPFDVIALFAGMAAQLRSGFARCKQKLCPNGGLWVAWPKKASMLATDLSENAVRAYGLESGLVDNKVCAIDDTWSGLRFVVRLHDRPRPK